MNVTVIYHSKDFDGIFCREIAKKFLPKDTKFIGWDYGDPIPNLDLNDDILMMDISILELMDFPNLTWIDHHISAIQKYPKNIKGIRIDGVAACRLAYAYFTNTIIPPKEKFLNREVKEPLAVRLVGEFDVWDHRGDGDLELQFGLSSQTTLDWESLLNDSCISLEDMGDPHDASSKYVNFLINIGRSVMLYVDKSQANYANRAAFLIEWEGLKFLALNTSASNSRAFEAKDTQETGHDALMKFSFDGEKWCFSLYQAKHKKDIDLSKIAVKHGGGGHAGACGFVCNELPFNLRNGKKI
jgi:oligoribonuclease NrnB/cAMP/cGMP phosphodiesterase (DHH superfamily)